MRAALRMTDPSLPKTGRHTAGLETRAGPLALATVVSALFIPAIWNGYPLLFHDSEDYVNMSFTFEPIVWRTMPYALLVAVGRLFDTLFAVVAVQAAIGGWVLHEFVAAFVPRRRAVALLVLGALLVGLTGLPWYVSQIMPDAFAGILVLGLVVLAHGQGLPGWRRVLLVFVVAISAASHMSHLAVAAGLLLALVGARVLAAHSGGMWPRPALGGATISVVLGLTAVPAVHGWATGEPYFARSGRVLQLALFVQDGIAQRYLDEVCPEGAPLKLCLVRDQLPETANAFLWAPWASPFEYVGGWTQMRDEADRIVSGAMSRFPWLVARSALANAATQLRLIKLGDGLTPKIRPGWTGEYYDTALQRYPGEFDRYATARQQRHGGIDFGPLNVVQTPVALATQAGLIVLLVIAWRTGDQAAAGAIVLILLALVGNAIVCGAMSNPIDRYQNRVVWLALAGCAMILMRLAQSGAPGRLG
jgi:hypothetical protein